MSKVLPALWALSVVLSWPVAPGGAATMLKCSGRVVWLMPAQKAYVLKNNPLYGKKPGSYVCESTAITKGYHMLPLNIARPLQRTGATTVSAASPAPNPSATPVASMNIPEDPTLTTLARSQIDVIRTGQINRAQYGDQLNAILTDQLVTQMSQVLSQVGAVTSFTYTGTADYNGLSVAQYLVAFEHPFQTTNQWIESIARDSSGKVVFLSFTPKT